MDILIEKVNALGVVQGKRSVKLPKARLLITIGDKRFFLNNLGDKPIVERIEPETKENQNNLNI